MSGLSDFELSIPLDQSLLNRLNAIAKVTDQPTADVVNKAIEHYLNLREE